MQTVAETKLFQRQVAELLSDEDRAELVDFLARNPLAGDVIPGLSGVRKVRWAAKGKGKRSGVRVIYYMLDETLPLYLLMAYAKNQQTDLTADERAAFGAFVARIKRAQ